MSSLQFTAVGTSDLSQRKGPLIISRAPDFERIMSSQVQRISKAMT